MPLVIRAFSMTRTATSHMSLYHVIHAVPAAVVLPFNKHLPMHAAVRYGSMAEGRHVGHAASSCDRQFSQSSTSGLLY